MKANDAHLYFLRDLGKHQMFFDILQFNNYNVQRGWVGVTPTPTTHPTPICHTWALGREGSLPA
jgi:hypothetical protein